MVYLYWALSWVAGCVFGYLACRSSKIYGVLKIDKGKDGEKSIYRFEIDDLDKVDSKEFIVLKIEDANLR